MQQNHNKNTRKFGGAPITDVSRNHEERNRNRTPKVNNPKVNKQTNQTPKTIPESEEDAQSKSTMNSRRSAEEQIQMVREESETEFSFDEKID